MNDNKELIKLLRTLSTSLTDAAYKMTAVPPMQEVGVDLAAMSSAIDVYRSGLEVTVKSIIDGDTGYSCYLCGRTGRMEVHHAIHGTANRRLADRYGLTVHLCPECHRKLHDKNEGNVLVEQAAEKAFSRRYGHEKWMDIFGKSFLNDAEEIEIEPWMNGFGDNENGWN